MCETNNAKLSLHFHLHHLLHGFLRTDIYPMFLQKINPVLRLNSPSHSHANLRTSLKRNRLSSIASRLIHHEHGVVLHLHARHVVLRDINPRHFHIGNVLEIPREHIVILAQSLTQAASLPFIAFSASYRHDELHHHVHVGIESHLLEVGADQHADVAIAFVVGLFGFDVGRQLVSVVASEEIADGGVGELAVEGEFVILVAVLDLFGERKGEEEYEEDRRSVVYGNAEVVEHCRVVLAEMNDEKTRREVAGDLRVSSIADWDLLEDFFELGVLVEVFRRRDEHQVQRHFRVASEHHALIAMLERNDQRQRFDRHPFLQQLHRHFYPFIPSNEPHSLRRIAFLQRCTRPLD